MGYLCLILQGQTGQASNERKPDSDVRFGIIPLREVLLFFYLLYNKEGQQPFSIEMYCTV